MRKIININENWTFLKGAVPEVVQLPHTWNAVDGQTGPELYNRGEYSYKKAITKPECSPETQIYLQCNGVNSSAMVYLNGIYLGSHDGGYSTFRLNLTSFMKEENELEIKVSNEANDKVYPQKADFTFYGGIYRDVSLILVDESHFDLDYYGGKGFLITPNVTGDDAEILFETYHVGKADQVVVTVEGVGDVTLLKTEESLSGKKKYEGSLFISKVHKWHGLEDPYLYNATAHLYQNGVEVDQISDSFGCRTYHFDPEQGFFLNGVSYPLHGVSRHQDRAGVGNALTKEMHEEDLELIREMGANSIRLAHYQHDAYVYELCDKIGFVVWAEIPYITIHMPTGRENTISQMKELIAQNYNHASIICWAISNEVSLKGVTEDLLENHRILNDLIHKMDKKRVSAMANLFLLETDSPLVTLPDIRGYNLYYGWYVGDMEDNDVWFDEFHRKHPDTVIGLTEYGADSVITLQSPKPEKGDYTESYQALYHEHMLEMFSTRPYIWGTYCWNMFEFAAAGRNEAGDPGKNHKGLITFDRKQKKDAFYIYKAWWSKEPFIHLCGRRYHDRIEPVTEIKVYTNQSKVTLFVDDKEVETKEGSHVIRFMIPITGTHKICVTVPGTSLVDTMEIGKVTEPNPSYFASKEKVKNWFEEPELVVRESEYLSLNSTMAEVQATPQGAALLGQMMEQMKKSVAGGMGDQAEIPQSMLAMIARQPLAKLLQQAGIDIEGPVAKQLAAALGNIKKGSK